MSVYTERVQAALRAAVDSAQKPTQSQILEVSGLTHIPDACEVIEMMIHRRLKHTEWYKPAETYHTLILMQKCLTIASAAFVDFCISRLNFVISLTRYERSFTPEDQEISNLVCHRASHLSQLLLNPTGLAEKRNILLADTASTVAPPTPQTTVPLPTPPSSPAKPIRQSPSGPLMGSGLLSLDPSPTDAFSQVRLNENIIKEPRHTNQPPRSTKEDSAASVSLFLLSRDDVAKLTFQSEELDIVLRALDAWLKNDILQRKDPEGLVKALTLVHHCLYWGSEPFVAYCRDIKAVLDPLQRHSVALVRSRAKVVVDLLEDDRRLQGERRARAHLLPHKTTSSPANLEHLPTIASKKPHDRRISIHEPVLDLSGRVKIVGTHPVTGGGYSDVWKGEYITDSGKAMVAIKILRRLNKVPPDRLEKRLNRELRVWRSVVHDNITPFYGIIIDSSGEVGMVSPFYSKGDVVEYAKRNQGVNPLEMLQEIAAGLEYLHAKKIIHGDLKGSNAMVDDTGVVKLLDFGVAQFLDDFATVTGYTTTNLASSLRWSAPELLIGDVANSSKSEYSDIYAFASLCVEIMTLRAPYHGKRDPQVLSHVLSGGTPERPSMEEKWSPCDELWDYLKTCWNNKPEDRPNIASVRKKLAEFYNGSIHPAPPIKRVRFVGDL